VLLAVTRPTRREMLALRRPTLAHVFGVILTRLR